MAVVVAIDSGSHLAAELPVEEVEVVLDVLGGLTPIANADRGMVMPIPVRAVAAVGAVGDRVARVGAYLGVWLRRCWERADARGQQLQLAQDLATARLVLGGHGTHVAQELLVDAAQGVTESADEMQLAHRDLGQAHAYLLDMLNQSGH